MNKRFKHATIIFFLTATVLFIAFSPILFKKEKTKKPSEGTVSMEEIKKDISESQKTPTAVETAPENNKEPQKETVAVVEKIQEAPKVVQEEAGETTFSEATESSSSFSSSGSSVVTSTPPPVISKSTTLKIQGSTYQIEIGENDTAFSVLLRAAEENNFTVSYQNYGSLGVFVSCIAGVCANNNCYWAFYYNGQYSNVGASSQRVFDGDTVLWKLENL